MMNTNETGRSMVEMLGVLAIIGVLSVGGIAGYNMAMTRYRANEVLNTATMMSMMAKSAEGGKGAAITTLAAAGLAAPYGSVTMSADKDGNVTVKNATSGVCAVVSASKSNVYSIDCTD